MPSVCLITRPLASSVCAVSRPSALRCVTVWLAYVHDELWPSMSNVVRSCVIVNGSRGLLSATLSLRLVRVLLPLGVVTVLSATTCTAVPQRGSGAYSTVVFVPSAAVSVVSPSTPATETVLAPLGSCTVRRRSPLASTSIEYLVVFPPADLIATVGPNSPSVRVSVRSSPSAPRWRVSRPSAS